MFIPHKKGFALIWSLLLITMLTITATTVATSITKDSKMSLNSTDSLRAYSAAQTGIEIAKNYLVTEAAFSFTGTVGGANYAVNYDPTVSSQIESIGKLGKITRKLEYKTDKQSALEPIKNDDILAATQGSATRVFRAERDFSFSYDFWLTSASATQSFKIANAANERMYLDVSGASISFHIYSSAGVSKNLTDLISLSSTGVPYAYNIKIDYAYGAYLRYTLTARDAGLTGTCTKSGLLDLSVAPPANYNFSSGSALTSLYSLTLDGSNTSLPNQVLKSGSDFYMDNFMGAGFTVGVPQISLNITTPTNGHIDYTVDGSPETCDSSGQGCGAIPVDTGASLVFTGVPDSGYQFTGWSGGACSGLASCSLTLNSTLTVTAGFGAAGAFTVTGGITTQAGGYEIHTFNSSGTLTISGIVSNVSVLIVGGGVNGADCGGPGGAGGQVRSLTNQTLGSSVAITVGGGNQPSSFGSTTAIAGGGNNGSSGAGGTGTASSISGTSTYYGGGGGGNHGAGGNRGGGAGGYNIPNPAWNYGTAGDDGQANTGGGGGGGGYGDDECGVVGNGGSGIVIVSFLGSSTTTPLTSIANITGTPKVGQALTAGALSPAGATASYQWQSSSTSGGVYANISGATATTYTPVAGDVGRYVKVMATGSGSYSGSVTSAATAVVTAAACVPSIVQGIALNTPTDGATVAPGNTTLSATANYTDSNSCAGHTVYLQILYNPAGTGTWYTSVIYSAATSVSGNFIANLPVGDYWWTAKYKVDSSDMTGATVAPSRLLHSASSSGTVIYSTGSGSWQVPAGVTSVKITIKGGGGGGGGGADWDSCDCAYSAPGGQNGNSTSIGYQSVTYFATGGGGGGGGWDDGSSGHFGGNGSGGSSSVSGGTLTGWTTTVGGGSIGGPGEGGNYGADGGNGGNGGQLYRASFTVTPGQSISYVIGAGGWGGGSANNGGGGQVIFEF